MDYNHDSSQAFPVNDEEQQFNRLKAQLHEQLIGGMNMSLVRTVEPGWLREEFAAARKNCAKTTRDSSARRTANG